MKDDTRNWDWIDYCICIALCVMALIVGVCKGVEVARSIHEQDAIKHGHAEYYLDQNHNRQWRWIPTPPPSK